MSLDLAPYFGIKQSAIASNRSAHFRAHRLSCKAAAPTMVFADTRRNNVVFFEHLFLGVGDMDVAHAFYEEGLGLVYDPSVRSGQKKGVGVSWLNIGDQQMHIDTGEDISRTPGPVKLFLPDLNALEHQLDKLAPRLKDTKFRADFSPDHHQATVVDPWGQTFSISERQSTHVREGSTIGSFEGLLLPCHTGTARAIAQFYKTMLQAETTEHSNADGQVYVQVELGHDTTFTFQEDPSLASLQTQGAIQAYEGWHCALYVAAFEETYNKIVQAGINQTDHPYKDKADTLEGAKQWNQFRFCDIIAVEDAPDNADVQYKKGHLLYRFGHEIRSLEHRRCPKVLLAEQ